MEHSAYQFHDSVTTRSFVAPRENFRGRSGNAHVFASFRCPDAVVRRLGARQDRLPASSRCPSICWYPRHMADDEHQFLVCDAPTHLHLQPSMRERPVSSIAPQNILGSVTSIENSPESFMISSPIRTVPCISLSYNRTWSCSHAAYFRYAADNR
jgi:hypothetical protein